MLVTDVLVEDFNLCIRRGYILVVIKETKASLGYR